MLTDGGYKLKCNFFNKSIRALSIMGMLLSLYFLSACAYWDSSQGVKSAAECSRRCGSFGQSPSYDSLTQTCTCQSHR